MPKIGSISLFGDDGGGGGGGVVTWVQVSSSTNMLPNYGYITTGPAHITLTLPAGSKVGDVSRVVGYGSGRWVVEPNTNQVIYYLGNTGKVQSHSFISPSYDTLEILCANISGGVTDFVVISSVGNVLVIN